MRLPVVSLRQFFVATIVLALSSFVLPAAARAKSVSVITWQPAKLVRGSPVLFQVSAPGAESVSGEWMGHKFPFFYEVGSKEWCALAGIPVETTAGTYELRLYEALPNRTITVARKVKVAPAKYLKIAAHVGKQFTEPSAEQLKQINADKNVKEAILATESTNRLWVGDFRPPVSEPISDVFGTERVFNGQVQSRHLGLDFAAPSGTPVHAVNRGIVLLAQALYFEGGFVVIDHGQGLLSLYLHLSDFRVKQGNEVAAGQVIGMSGSSGRATGPHLHLAIRWQGVYLDPAVLLKIRVP